MGAFSCRTSPDTLPIISAIDLNRAEQLIAGKGLAEA